MKKLVGKVTEEEKKQIKTLFERKNGLAELAQIIDGNDELYEKVLLDIGRTSIKFQEWWDQTSEKYKWEMCLEGRWEIDFDSAEIYLVKDQN